MEKILLSFFCFFIILFVYRDGPKGCKTAQYWASGVGVTRMQHCTALGEARVILNDSPEIKVGNLVAHAVQTRYCVRPNARHAFVLFAVIHSVETVAEWKVGGYLVLWNIMITQ